MSSQPKGQLDRVLVVDDDPVVRVLASHSLAAMGFSVEEAEDGPGALSAIDRSCPDLILLDVEMPGMDGFETCIELRKLPAGREIPVLIATGLTDSETIDRAFQAGATDFIKKPLDWQLLQHRVRFLMRASNAFSELRQTLGELRNSQERLANAQRLARIGNWEWMVDSDEMLWSAELYRMLGLEPRPGVLTSESFLAVVHPDDRSSVEKALQAARSEAKPWSFDHRIISESEEGERIVHHQAEVTRGPSGVAERVTGTIQDITERRRAEEQIRYLAYYDSLTALPNRRLLLQHLDGLLERARRHGQTFALLFIDLDRFKRVNDTLGHMVGDELLKEVASRLVSSVRATDHVGRPAKQPATVSRLGGDEFLIVLNQTRSPEDAGVVARRILDALHAPLSLSGQEIVMSASIGIASYPADGQDVNTLMRNADTAMYHAKSAGRGVYQFFSRSMNEKAMRNLRLESGLRGAVEREELVLHYQPQREVQTGAIEAVEALVRWRSEEFGLVAPGEFIPLAEETGLVVPLGEWVLRRACAQVVAWRQAGLPPLRIAVNVSSIQLRQEGLLDTVERALRDSGLDPRDLELEMTESALIGNEPRVIENLRGIKAMGVSLALDDFGTGYSSLSHLVNFPIDTIKIDRSFVKKIGSDDQATAVAAAVVAMSHRLGLRVVAEGVETDEQEALLRAEGCDLLQGFHISPPAEADSFAAFMRGDHAARAQRARV